MSRGRGGATKTRSRGSASIGLWGYFFSLFGYTGSLDFQPSLEGSFSLCRGFFFALFARLPRRGRVSKVVTRRGADRVAAAGSERVRYGTFAKMAAVVVAKKDSSALFTCLRKPKEVSTMGWGNENVRMAGEENRTKTNKGLTENSERVLLQRERHERLGGGVVLLNEAASRSSNSNNAPPRPPPPQHVMDNEIREKETTENGNKIRCGAVDERWNLHRQSNMRK